ncbi:MAG TPA: hypothetical protein VKH18_11965 [Terriglobales bacterium]|nr:hypothetical protein [Terriglobales bacterium]
MDRTAISDQIDRILRSQSFASKSQLRKLLEVLFNNMDLQTTLKPDRVIRELWPEETKTKGSADVATEMNRLRRALESYYNGEGKTDPIVISLPNRSVPAADGTQEKRWIAATPREEETAGSRLANEDQRSIPQVSARRGLRVAAAIAAIGIVGYISMRVLGADDLPQSGRLDATTLTIMNAEGKELWRKVFPEGFTSDWYFEKSLGSRLWFGDLEGKGHTSVLFLYTPANQQSHSSTLICYSDRGKEKWRWIPGRELPELNGSPATFRTAALGVLKATDKRPLRIVVSSIHNIWWPSQIALLEANGKTVSEYWHSGALTYMILADLDGDGREEIVAAGVSEYDHQATLVVLDPDRVFGASTEERPDVQIHGMGVAQERLRLLFPRSDLNKTLFQFNWATEPTVERGSIRLSVTECITPPGCRIYYEFDKNFRLIAAYAGSDEFRSAHARFYQSGNDAHPLSAEEQGAFQKVRCLVGCKSEFVPVGKLVP